MSSQITHAFDPYHLESFTASSFIILNSYVNILFFSHSCPDSFNSLSRYASFHTITVECHTAQMDTFVTQNKMAERDLFFTYFFHGYRRVCMYAVVLLFLFFLGNFEAFSHSFLTVILLALYVIRYYIFYGIF